MSDFTPVQSTLGGLLIGLSASVLLIGAGRVAGISGVLGRLVAAPRTDAGWRMCFLAGLLAGAFGAFWLRPAWFSMPAARPIGAVVLAGLLVGVGTALGNGCTSGHGVCGLSRLSRRSLAATITFMAMGMLSALVARRLFGAP